MRVGEVQRGEIWWANLPAPVGSGPGYGRPVLIVQSNEFNSSPIRTIVVAAITSNLRLALARGNVFCPKGATGLPRESVINVSQLLTIDKSLLTERVGTVSSTIVQQVEAGLRLVLAL